MKFKIFLFIFVSAFLINDVLSRKFSFGKISRGFSRGSSHAGSSGRISSGSSRGGYSHGVSSSGTSHGTSLGKSSANVGLKPSGSGSIQQNKNINTNFLNAEGGGATRPRKPGVITESKQTSGIPSAPQDHIMKTSTGTLQNSGTGHASPPWSNPYLGTNIPAVPAQSYPPRSNPHLGINKPNTQPTMQGSYPPQIGFRDHVYPQKQPISPSTQFSPSMTGHPPYPIHPTHSGNPWSGSSPVSPPLHQTNSMPLGNPYSIHTPGGAYNAPTYGQHYYSQQPQMLAQPAMQPFVPGQTILMMPAQDSGRGVGQLVKEALVYSTINAGVNRLINPHHHSHYYSESRSDAAAATPVPTTHITYNNQYFNTPPGAAGTINSANVTQGAEAPSNPNGASTSSVPQAQGSVNNQPSGATNAGETNRPSSGNANSYTPRSHSSDASSSSSAGSDRSTATPVTGLNAANDQNSTPNNLLYRISDDELYRISEELFAKNSHNISKYIKLNLQTRVTSPNVTDKANEQLFNVDLELFQYPSIYVIRSLYDNYEHDFLKKLNRTLETRKQENLLIDTFLNTNEMSTTMQWLADRGFIDPDDFERKDVLRRIWFTIFSGSTCGFERVFASENYGTAIVGVQDWIYFAHQESLKRIDYMGYVDKLNFGTTASLLKLNFQMDGIIRPNATIFVGTLPELEMSLYTICFYARPNDLCPVSLGGTKFNIYTHSFTYFGSQTIDLALPMF
ncbi:unnamed protein product [Xylocopa violacea]|uniref:EndoU domain-containing protein n=1 Tax=Xylocopa violacea TaxID=135666 RepID=A0ABP1NRS2_XYLVO